MLTSVSNRAEDIQGTRSRTPGRGGGLSTQKPDRKVRAEIREKKTE